MGASKFTQPDFDVAIRKAWGQILAFGRRVRGRDERREPGEFVSPRRGVDLQHLKHCWNIIAPSRTAFHQCLVTEPALQERIIFTEDGQWTGPAGHHNETKFRSLIDDGDHRTRVG